MGKKVDLTKSIDSFIDELFAEETVKKSDMPENLNVAGQSSTTADAVASKAPKAQDDKSRGAGRPDEISDVPNVDQDGKRAGKYDDDIAKKQAEEENEEGKKQADAKRSDQTMGEQRKDSMSAAMGKSISDEEMAEFRAFQKAKSEKAQEETLKKARQENEALIKSAVAAATAPMQKENAELRKSLNETQELIKAMAERPQRRKSVDGIQALEKSQGEEPKGPENFSKAEMLDVAEELVAKSVAAKDMAFRDEHLIELENTGYIYEPRARAIFETALKNRK